jgi:hypothetical protein
MLAEGIASKYQMAKYYLSLVTLDHTGTAGDLLGDAGN